VLGNIESLNPQTCKGFVLSATRINSARLLKGRLRLFADIATINCMQAQTQKLENVKILI
jgi:uncharacterized protein YerC